MPRYMSRGKGGGVTVARRTMPCGTMVSLLTADDSGASGMLEGDSACDVVREARGQWQVEVASLFVAYVWRR